MPTPSSVASHKFTLILVVVAFLLGWFSSSYWPRGAESQAKSSPAPRNQTPVMEIPAGQTVVGFLDMVKGKPDVFPGPDGKAEISGWAGCADPGSTVTKVEILVDEHVRADVAIAYPRADVATAYGRPDFEKSGWKSSFSLQGIGAGEHPLRARSTCSKGEIGLSPKFILHVN